MEAKLEHRLWNTLKNMRKIFFIYKNEPYFLIPKDNNICQMNTEKEVIQPEQTE